MRFQKYKFQILIKLFLTVALAMGNCQIQAQTYALDYDTEWQTNFKGDYNWLNLLKMSASLPVSHALTLEGSAISVANASNEPLIDDLQGYSNIEAGNLPFAIAVLGANMEISKSSIFLGIRNVNEDYFTSPVTSFFTNSSCGIFPTLSCNYDIANYPLASWCMHYKIEVRKCVLQTSLYTGQGSKRLAGRDNVFSISPSKHGLFSISSLEYTNNGSNYTLGCAVHYGVRNSDDHGGEKATATQTKKTLSAAPWLNIEHSISKRCSLLLQGSFSTAEYCKYYFGVGATFSAGKLQYGIFTDYAKIGGCGENATELCCLIPITDQVTLRPTIDAIITDTHSHLHTVALMRLSIAL